MVFTKVQKDLIKIGFLKWRKPIEIATLINTFNLGPIKAFDIYNYIQMMQSSWIDEIPYCGKCNVDMSDHDRCPICERLLHNGDNCCTGPYISRL